LIRAALQPFHFLKRTKLPQQAAHEIKANVNALVGRAVERPTCACAAALIAQVFDILAV
jgi:hypothetical protein